MANKNTQLTGAQYMSELASALQNEYARKGTSAKSDEYNRTTTAKQVPATTPITVGGKTLAVPTSGTLRGHSYDLSNPKGTAGGIDLFQDPEGENIVKIILGTVGDAAVDLGKGITRFSEGIADSILYGIGDAAKLFGYTDADLRDFRRRTAASTTDQWFGGADNYLDQHSVLGRTSDAILEGAGQAAAIVGLGGFGAGAGLGTTGTTALTTGASFVSGAGSGRGEAYQGGATDAEARTYGVISGAADAITELIFGGLGKSVKAFGVGKGLSSADDMLAKTLGNKVTKALSKLISNERVLRAIGNTTELGVKMSAEGAEEVLAGLAQAVGKKITYMSEEDLGKIIQDENLLEQFLVGAATSGIMQGGDLHRANRGNVDLVTGFTQNEHAVVEQEVKNRVAQEEKGGKKLSGKEKSAIYEQVVKDMERGYISTETIESVLGKDALTQYDALSKEAEEFKTLYETEGGKLSEKQKDRLAELKEKNKANPYEQLLKSQREKISKDVSALAQKDRLGESYAEQTRKGEKFQADVSKYSEAQRKTVQNAIDSGILNNTNRSHEFVDLVAKVSADRGISFDFADNAKLKESGFALDGVLVNGFVNENGVTINIQSAKALNRVVGHEITHVLEGTELYDALQSAVTEYAKTKKEYNRRLKELTELYEGKNANVEQELVADLVGDYLFTDADFIKHLSTEHRNLFQKIYDEIKYLCKVVTAGSKEARQLEKVKKAFADAYRAETKNPTADGGTKYSLGQYSDAQKENWKKSRKIVVYENDAQLLQFVKDSIANKDADNKMYFGVISGDLAKRIMADTGLDFNGKNAVLRAKNVRKILLHDHGNVESEKLRGQVAVTETDFLEIKDIFGDPDAIKPEPQGYNGKPAATFEKVIGGKKYTMFVVDSGGSLDIFVQTMYIHKQKGSIANVANAKALTSTPKATVGTAPTTNVQQNNPVVKQQNSLSKKDSSVAPPVGADVYGRDIAAHPDDWIPIRKDIPQKAANGQAYSFSDPSDPNFAPPTQQTIANVLDVEPKTAQQKRNRLWALTKANLFDKGAVFEDLSLQTKNRELMGKWNYILSSEARAQYLIGHGAEGVKSLNDIREQVIDSGKAKEFYEYLYHRLNADRMTLNTRYKDADGNPAKNKPVFGDTVTAEISRSAIEQYEEQFPEFKEFAQDVYDYMNHLRKLMIDSGMISQKTADLWAEMYPSYVPVRRAGKEGNAVNVSLYTGRAPIKSAKGGNSDILPLFDTMALRTIQTYKAIAKNNFGVELKNSLNSAQQITEETIDDATDGVDDQNSLLQAGTINKTPHLLYLRMAKRSLLK